MSLIIAIKTDDYILMGCDSQVSYGGNKYSLDNVSACKIWRINNCPFGIMGSVGNLRDCQLIAAQEYLINPARILSDDINFNYVVCELFSSIYKVLEDYGRVKQNELFIDDEDAFKYPTLDNEFIFAYGLDAWEISMDGCVREIDDYLVIGSGRDVAIGVLDNNKDKDPEDRICEAIETCMNNTLFVDGNIVMCKTIDAEEDEDDEKEEEKKDETELMVRDKLEKKLEDDDKYKDKSRKKTKRMKDV